MSEDKCQRCGTCCRKGPPGLHRQDAWIYARGYIGKEHILTLRKGERVFDNVWECFEFLPEEMLRLRSKSRARECIFFHSEKNSCAVYEYRPAECRALKCWDTRELKQMYKQERLSRYDLLDSNSALGQIIQEHEQQCPYSRVTALVQEFKQKKDKQVLAPLTRLLDQDLYIRDYVQKNTQASQEVLEFLFGRPLTETLPNLGLGVEKVDQEYKYTELTSFYSDTVL